MLGGVAWPGNRSGGTHLGSSRMMGARGRCVASTGGQAKAGWHAEGGAACRGRGGMLRAVACKGWQAKAGWHVGGMLRDAC